MSLTTLKAPLRAAGGGRWQGIFSGYQLLESQRSFWGRGQLQEPVPQVAEALGTRVAQQQLDVLA